MATKKKKSVKKVTKKAIKKTAVIKATKVAVKPVARKKIKKSQPKKSAKKVVAKKTTKKVVTSAKVAQTIKAKKPALKVDIDYSKAITPLGDRLVVRVEMSEKVTPGGIIIPDSASSIASGHLKARVLAVGFGGKSKKGHLQPLDVKIGDLVLFSEHSGTKVTFNSEELQIIHESDVMGVVQN